jgi:hypothetical protein
MKVPIRFVIRLNALFVYEFDIMGTVRDDGNLEVTPPEEILRLTPKQRTAAGAWELHMKIARDEGGGYYCECNLDDFVDGDVLRQKWLAELKS